MTGADRLVPRVATTGPPGRSTSAAGCGCGTSTRPRGGPVGGPVGRAGQAQELLAQGRAVLWSQPLERRADLAALAEAAPALSARLRAVRADLDHPPAAGPASA